MKLLPPDIPWSGDEIVEDEFVVVVTRGELATMAGAINEAIEAVEGWEFETRLGVTLEQARDLRARIAEILRETFRPE